MTQTFQNLVEMRLEVVYPPEILLNGVVFEPVLSDPHLRIPVLVLDQVQQPPQTPRHRVQPGGT